MILILKDKSPTTSNFQKSFRYDEIFGWKLSEWIRDRFERTIGDLAL